MQLGLSCKVLIESGILRMKQLIYCWWLNAVILLSYVTNEFMSLTLYQRQMLFGWISRERAAFDRLVCIAKLWSIPTILMKVRLDPEMIAGQLRVMYQVGQNKTKYTRFVGDSRIWYHEMLYWSFIHSIWLPSNILPLLRPLFWVLWAGHLHTDCVHVASAPLLTSVMSPLQMGQTVKGIFVLSMMHKLRLLQWNDLLMNEFKSHLS